MICKYYNLNQCGKQKMKENFASEVNEKNEN